MELFPQGLAILVTGVIYFLETRREESILVTLMERKLLGVFFSRDTLQVISAVVGVLVIIAGIAITGSALFA